MIVIVARTGAIFMGVALTVGMAIRTGGRETHSATRLAMVSATARTVLELYRGVLDRESEPLCARQVGILPVPQHVLKPRSRHVEQPRRL